MNALIHRLGRWCRLWLRWGLVLACCLSMSACMSKMSKLQPRSPYQSMKTSSLSPQQAETEVNHLLGEINRLESTHPALRGLAPKVAIARQSVSKPTNPEPQKREPSSKRPADSSLGTMNPPRPMPAPRNRPSPPPPSTRAESAGGMDVVSVKRSRRRRRRLTPCQRICRAADGICRSSARICSIARRFPTNPRFQQACQRAQVHCNNAHQQCRSCR